MNSVHTSSRKPNLARIAAGAAIALALGVIATPALADNDRHRGQRGHHGWQGGPHHKHHHHGPVRYYPAPAYYYAPPPPPVVYVPRPVYHHPPQPGLTIVFPLGGIF